ncbi:indolepyruvate ferredoxin oxidoreductase family protein [Nocardia sp. NPDC049707]|uniref:indolepyruvate ferredoxin oxidoreductase family protein n=1 Tax=Nocardia sp. NPDC049707 TaxID=3154735 RepID=UPI00342AC9B6
MTELRSRQFTLEDRYQHQGEILLTGLQALVRVPIEQSRRDTAAGRHVGTLISGYEGSPLAGYDLELHRQSKLLADHRIVFRPGVNEELAANAVQGSQLASASDTREVDGVVGIWYGKAPGLDRATDALRHANLGGADKDGGALVLVGDDSIAKSSTVPSSSEVAMAEIGLPVLVPADPQEILDLGLHGVAMSRFSGLWVGMKLATNVVDGSATVDLGRVGRNIRLPNCEVEGTPFTHEVSAHFLQPNLARLEKTLHGARAELALRYVRDNGLNSIEGDPDAALGIITAGAPFRDTLEALERLGLSREGLAESGVRILKLSAISPLDRDLVRQFAEGLTEIVVIEEKRPFIELGVKDALYDLDRKPAVVGKRDTDGAPFIRPDADLPPEYLASKLAKRLVVVLPEGRRAGLELVERKHVGSRIQLPLLTRTPYFCSGCPHNRSTVVPEGSLVGAGIGCHTIAALMPSSRVGEIVSLSQMGGEGAPWIGMAPFVRDQHLFQNLGDGTFHHSGLLAIRAAVAGQVNITYKLLYNDAVAMTGGQDAVGKMSVPMIAQELIAEGVRRVVITTDDRSKYRRARLPRGVRVFDRAELVPVQEELARTPGVTVLIHDQACATELRRKRKRGKAKDPVVRAFINERVCEGCGDCAQKSNCMSVQPVETAFGRKTRIDQPSCNKDYSCLEGDCPSFILVRPGKKGTGSPKSAPIALPEPVHRVDPSRFNVRITGVGGTGVVTTAQILATAGTLAGFNVRGLDQLGLAQKGGAVVSDLRFSIEPIDGTNKIAPGDCDLYLGCDILVAAAEHNLLGVSSDRTIAVVSTSRVPTGAMILEPSTSFPDLESIRGLIDTKTRGADSWYADARAIAQREFGSDQFANMVLVGLAVQAGALPLPIPSIEQAISLNGVAVDGNLRALRVGREHIIAPAPAAAPSRFADSSRAHAELRRALANLAGMDEVLKDRVATLALELANYQSEAYGLRFVEYVEQLAGSEQARLGRVGAVTATGAESMFKLMAYKDEYEVARLSLDPIFLSAVEHQFGTGASIRYQLHPPLLRALGLKRKLSLGAWFTPALRALKAGRRLRGTVLDPFGYARMRRLERRLVREYWALTESAVALLTNANDERVQAILALPQEIRGYEDIKLNSIREYEARVLESMTSLTKLES